MVSSPPPPSSVFAPGVAGDRVGLRRADHALDVGQRVAALAACGARGQVDGHRRGGILEARRVAAGAAAQRVGAGAAQQDVVPAAAVERVIAAEAAHHVVARRAVEHVVASRAGDRAHRRSRLPGAAPRAHQRDRDHHCRSRRACASRTTHQEPLRRRPPDSCAGSSRPACPGLAPGRAGPEAAGLPAGGPRAGGAPARTAPAPTRTRSAAAASRTAGPARPARRRRRPSPAAGRSRRTRTTRSAPSASSASRWLVITRSAPPSRCQLGFALRSASAFFDALYARLAAPVTARPTGPPNSRNDRRYWASSPK